MWVNAIPWAPPGYTNLWQGLWLYFSEGLKLEFSTDDQFFRYDNNMAVYISPLGVPILDNIYQLFRGWDIKIPEGPLYLEAIDFVQQLADLDTSDPGGQEYQQHMEVDFIQIIEAKE